MEISVLSASLNTATSIKARPLPEPGQAADGVDRCAKTSNRHCHRSEPDTALKVFRQELHSSLRARFRTELGAGLGAYTTNTGAPGPEEVASEALGVARQVVAQSPTTAARSLIEFRSRVHESVEVARQVVVNQDDMKDVDHAVARLDDGISDMQETAASTRESSASALEVDMRTKQRTTIKIHTQEGDVVKLSLRKFSELSATDSQSTEVDKASSETNIEFSSRSRMLMKVRGDLNEAELGAIQGVLGQAQQMADAFFGGDIGAAFEAAGGFSFDNEQLANVNLRFRMRQVSNTSYTETIGPAAPLKEPTPDIVPAPRSEAPQTTVADAPKTEAAPSVEAPVDDVAVVEDPTIASVPIAESDALSSFFEMVGSFLRSVSEGFEGVASNTSVHFQYSETFKLSLLQSVIHAAAPDESTNASANAVEAIEQMKETEA